MASSQNNSSRNQSSRNKSPRNKSRKRKNNRAQAIGAVCFSVLAIVTLVVVGLFLGGTLNLEMFGFGGQDTGYKNITLTDAQYACEKEARAEYASRIATMTVDSLSSRYDDSSNRYRMYFSLDLYPERGKDRNIPVNYFLNCFVHGSRGTVTTFESVENKQDQPKPIRKTEGNIFGL